MFQGLREHAPLYILEKGCPHKLTVGYVERVTNPVSKDGLITGVPMFGQQEMVVDVYVKIGDTSQKLEKLPANKVATTPEDNPNVFVTENLDTMLAEVENIERTCNTELEKMPYYSTVAESCAEIKLMLNPQLAKEKERDNEIAQLKTEVSSIKGSIDEMVALIKAQSSGSKKKE